MRGLGNKQEGTGLEEAKVPPVSAASPGILRLKAPDLVFANIVRAAMVCLVLGYSLDFYLCHAYLSSVASDPHRVMIHLRELATPRGHYPGDLTAARIVNIMDGCRTWIGVGHAMLLVGAAIWGLASPLSLAAHRSNPRSHLVGAIAGLGLLGLATTPSFHPNARTFAAVNTVAVDVFGAFILVLCALFLSRPRPSGKVRSRLNAAAVSLVLTASVIFADLRANPYLLVVLALFTTVAMLSIGQLLGSGGETAQLGPVEQAPVA